MAGEDIAVAPIRNAVRALIVVDEAVLIQQKNLRGRQRMILFAGRLSAPRRNAPASSAT
jgi:hypothetical protein